MDEFFSQKKCSRCIEELKIRKMSWFNDDVLCQKCCNEESDLRRELQRSRGHDFEGCNLHISQIRMMAKK